MDMDAGEVVLSSYIAAEDINKLINNTQVAHGTRREAAAAKKLQVCQCVLP